MKAVLTTVDKRQRQIDGGRIWQVFIDPDNILFEGSKTKCKSFIKNSGLVGLRLAKLIMEL